LRRFFTRTGDDDMKQTMLGLAVLVVLLAASRGAEAQLGVFSTEQRVAVTAAWTGERFPDGRPKVADGILEGMKKVTAEEAWGVLHSAGFKLQFEGGWKEINAGAPGRRLVGRVVTAVFMPLRPDLKAAIDKAAAEEKRVSRGQGVIVDGSVRDLSGILQIQGFQGFVRDFHPSVLADVTLAGINVPVRIGGVTVLPGDVVLSDPEGLTFIPPQLAEKIVTSSEEVRMRDEWSHEMLRQGKYTPGQVDTSWTPAMEAEYKAWLAQQPKP
jgi:4-hydroxy-4-methyl-2-oxoglutarate aldolase